MAGRQGMKPKSEVNIMAAKKENVNLNTILEPGMLVRHPKQQEWGLGQVQSNISGRITVNFEHGGKVVINGDSVALAQVFDA